MKTEAISNASFRKFLTQNTLASIGAQVIAIALSSILGIVLARTLGVAGYGDFSYAYTLLLLAVIPGKLGLDTTVMKLAASYEKSEDLPRMQGAFRFALFGGLRASLLVALAGLLLLWVAGDRISGSLYSTILLATLCVPVLALLHILQYSAYGLRRYILAQLPESILRPFFLIILCLVFYQATGPISAPDVMLANSVLTAILLVLTFYKIRQALPRGTFETTPIFENASWWKTSRAMLTISSLNLIFAQTDILLVGYFCGTYDAGLYNAAARIAALVLFLHAIVNAVAAPIISRAYVSGELDLLRRMSITAQRVILVSTLCLAVPAFWFGRELLWLFGSDFQVAYPILALLLVSQVFKAATGIGGFILTMTNHEALSARLSLTAAVLSLVLALALIPSYGAVGAAVSTAVASVTWSICVLWIVKRRFGF